MKDAEAPHDPIHGWDMIGRLRLRFNHDGVCSMMDTKIDESVHQRLNHLSDYQPDNIMPFIRPILESSKQDIHKESNSPTVGLIFSV